MTRTLLNASALTLALTAAVSLGSSNLGAGSVESSLPDGGSVSVVIGDSAVSVGVSAPSIGFSFSDSFSFGSGDSGGEAGFPGVGGLGTEGQASPLGGKGKGRKVLPLQNLSTGSRTAARGGGAESASRALAASITGGSSPVAASAPLNYSASAAPFEGQTGPGTTGAAASTISAISAVPIDGVDSGVVTSGPIAYSPAKDSDLVLVELPEFGAFSFAFANHEPSAAERDAMVQMMARQGDSAAAALTSAGLVIMPALQAAELAGKGATLVLFFVTPAGITAASSATLLELYAAAQLAKAMDDGLNAYNAQKAAGGSTANAAFAALAVTGTNVAVGAAKGNAIGRLADNSLKSINGVPVTETAKGLAIIATQLNAWALEDEINNGVQRGVSGKPGP